MNNELFTWNVFLVHDLFQVMVTPFAVSKADAQEQAEGILRDNGVPSWIIDDAQQVVTERA